MSIKHTLVSFAALLLFTLSSCQKIDLGTAADETTTTTTTEIPSGKGLLKLSLAAADNTGSTVSLPAAVYLFNSKNECVAYQEITETGTTSVEIAVKGGTYQLYAVGGLDTSVYDVPTKDNITPASLIALKSGKEHTDLMIASEADVKLTSGKQTDVTLSLTRVIAQLQSISVKNVPTDVTAVKVTLSPLYTTAKLDGTLDETSEISKEITLEKGTDGTTWSTTEAINILPVSSGETSIKYEFIKTRSIRQFTLTTSQITANHKISLDATYKPEELATLSCTLSQATWDDDIILTPDLDETKMLQREFDEEGEEIAQPNFTIEEPLSGNKSVGDKFGSYGRVLRIQNSENYKYLTIVSVKDTAALTSAAVVSQTEMKAATEAAFAKMPTSSTSAIKQWSLPTEAQINYIAKNITSLNKVLSGCTFATSAMYYFNNSAGGIGSYSIKSQGEVEDFDTSKSTLHLRGFAVIRYDLK